MSWMKSLKLYHILLRNFLLHGPTMVKSQPLYSIDQLLLNLHRTKRSSPLFSQHLPSNLNYLSTLLNSQIYAHIKFNLGSLLIQNFSMFLHTKILILIQSLLIHIYELFFSQFLTYIFFSLYRKSYTVLASFFLSLLLFPIYLYLSLLLLV